MTYKLSILIPARNEVYHEIDLLHETVTNVLANTSEQCEIVCVLDGYDNGWPLDPLPANPRLRVIQHSQSIGQRAATNEAAWIATGEWVCKLDAHCAVGPDFDTRLLEGAQPHWTIVPGQYNLQVFEWKCRKCDWRKDQSPKPARCEKCNSRYIKQVKIWKPRDGEEGRRRAYTHSWRFDTNLDFQYFGAYASDEKYCKKHGIPFRPETQQPLHDTMSLLGACWAMTRERYFYLEPCDESFGSWGDMGTEISCKVWLSGGELKVNQNTWFAHFFRVGGIGFPYADGGRKERAKARGKELWLNNKWPKQIYPLSWLIDRFNPLPDWHSGNNPVLAQVNAAGEKFTPAVTCGIGGLLTNSTHSSVPFRVFSQDVTTNAVGLSGVDSGRDVASLNIVPVVGNQRNVGGVTAGLVITDDMIQDGNCPGPTSGQGSNQPCIHESMNKLNAAPVLDMAIAPAISGACPNPASSGLTDGDLTENIRKPLTAQVSNSESAVRHGLIIPQTKRRAGIIYYTCNSHDETLELAARNNLKSAVGGRGEIGCVALQRTDFGDWTIVLDREKSGGTMHYQILAGLERSTADYVFLCESDVFYHPSHFDFVPPRDDTFYYNTNVWRVRYSDGHAVRTANLQQVSGICANRQLLLEHYRRRTEIIAQNNGQFDVKSMAYEPGTRGKFGDEKIANWQSEFPNLDITGHGQTLTTPHFSIDSFRNKKYAEGWEETDDEIIGWGKLSGRLGEFLAEWATGGVQAESPRSLREGRVALVGQ